MKGSNCILLSQVIQAITAYNFGHIVKLRWLKFMGRVIRTRTCLFYLIIGIKIDKFIKLVIGRRGA